jgi:nitric oxide reductase activation protein
LDESLAERLDVEDMDSARAPDDRDVSRWESLVEQIEKYGRDVERRKRERDERLTDERIWSDDARDRARNSGAIRRLKDGLRQLVTRPTPEPALQGPEIDMRNVVRRASGQKNVKKVFRESVETETGDRCIGLATDLSGSMHRDMDDLRVACGVIAEATDIIGDDFVWSSFQYKYGENTLRLVTGPNEDFKWRHVDSVQAGGDEPTAAGIRDCRSLMEQTTARTHVLLCITDGKALVTEDGRRTMDEEPIRHARQAVRECRHEGVEVIGVGIGSMDEQKMAETFGDGNYVLTSIDTLAEDILDIYQEQMTVSR